MKQPLTRRRFLGAAAATGGAAGLTLFPRSFRKALAATPARGVGSLSEVKHVLFMMQENRTFDHYFGALSGVRGFDDPTAMRLPNGKPVWFQPNPSNPDGYTLPFHLDTTSTSEAVGVGLDNGWVATHNSWNNGLMDNFVPAEVGAGANAPLTMGHFDRGDIPFHYALADAFTVCDNFHCSVLGPSQPNHLYAISATIDPAGVNGGPVLDNSVNNVYTWTTYFERLQDAGITWRWYVQQPPAGPELGAFAQFANAPKNSPLYQNGMVPRPYPALLDDIKNDRLPQFVRIAAQFPPESDEHPGQSMPAIGAEFMYDLLDAFGSSPEVWAKTVLFIAYDDAGGLFDHVLPPTAPPGTPGEYLTVSPLPANAGAIAGPIGLGLRVAALVISPWSRGGWVASETFDFTSIIRFCERRFGVQEPNISAWRRQAVGDLTSTLRLGQLDLSVPEFPDPALNQLLEQQEVATFGAANVQPTPQIVPRQEPAGARLVQLSASSGARVVAPGKTVTITAVLRNPRSTGGQSQAGATRVLQRRPLEPTPLSGVKLTVTVPAGWSQQARTATSFAHLNPGQEVSAVWQLTAPAQVSATTVGHFPVVAATYQLPSGGQVDEVLQDAVVVLAGAPVTLAQCFNNVGIIDDGAADATFFDMGFYNYSSATLAAAGLTPGSTVSSGGVQYRMPNVPSAQPDNAIAGGQTIIASGVDGAKLLGFLGAATSSDSSGELLISYTDGSTQTETLSFTDWDSPASHANTAVATLPYRLGFPGTKQVQPVSIFATKPIALRPGKTLQYVTLPAEPTEKAAGAIHVFSIGTDKGPLS